MESKVTQLRGTFGGMGGRKPGRPGITEDQAENVRELLRRVRDERYGGNATALAGALQITPSAVSQMISRKNRPSYDTVLGLARLLDADPGDILAGTVAPRSAAGDVYPERARALGRLRGLLPPEVEEAIRSTVVHDGPPLTETQWINLALRELAEHDREAALRARVAPARTRRTQ